MTGRAESKTRLASQHATLASRIAFVIAKNILTSLPSVWESRWETYWAKRHQ